MHFKGFIFTLDSIFALVIATASMSLLLYIYFVSPISTHALATKSSSAISSMHSVTLGAVASSGYFSNLNNPYLQGTYFASFGSMSLFYAPIGSWINSNKNFTISFWMYPNAPGGPAAVLSNTIYGNGWTANIIGMNANGIIYAGVPGLNGNMPLTFNGIFGKWYMLTLSYNASGKESFYVNGKLAGSATGTYSYTGAYTYLLTYLNSLAFHGIITNLQIYNACLTSNEVQAMYVAGIGSMPIIKPFAWYPLNGNANDYSGNGNNAYFSGSYISANTIIFGNFTLPFSSSLFYAIPELYANRQGGYGTLLYSSIGNLSSSEFFMNGIYAPSMYLPQFNGVNSIISIPNPMQVSQFSISLWIYPYAIKNSVIFYSYSNSRYPTIILQQGNSGCSGSSGSSGFNVKASFGGFALCMPIGNANNWYNIVFAYGKGGVLSLALNKQQFVYSNSSLISSANVMLSSQSIGSCIGCSLGAFNGSIANLQVYGTPFLTSGPILQLYNRGLGMPLQNAIEWLPLNGNANDYSMNFSNGIPNNISYKNMTFTPYSLQNAYSQSGSIAQMPVQINGNLSIENISVVSWT